MTPWGFWLMGFSWSSCACTLPAHRLLICCVLTGLLAALGQTLALYVDSKMFGYYRYEIVFGVMIWRIVIYALFSGIFGYVSIPIVTALRKAKLV